MNAQLASALIPVLLARVHAVQRHRPPRRFEYECAECGCKIPPGRHGRKCEECRQTENARPILGLSLVQFVARYAARSGVSVAELLETQQPVPCACGQPDCQGWAMKTKASAVSANTPPNKVRRLIYRDGQAEPDREPCSMQDLMPRDYFEVDNYPGVFVLTGPPRKLPNGQYTVSSLKKEQWEALDEKGKGDVIIQATLS